MLRGIAYRMLGSFSDAEDIVQDAYLRWQRINLSRVESASAYLASTVSRLCIDRLRRVKVERLLYTGPWLPEPLGDDVVAELTGPEQYQHQVESISMAFVLLLQKLPPTERAVFVLREAFDLPHEQIADMLNIRAAHSRQLLRRAKQKIDAEDIQEVDEGQLQDLMTNFMSAVATGDLESLHEIMTDDIVFYSDGGGRVSAALIPLVDKVKTATVLMHLMSKNQEQLLPSWENINGTPSLVLRGAGGIHSCHTIVVRDSKVHRIYTIRNPDKLHFL
jgi:RNA polymerase sigma-70 factor (ECF subfamily)